MLQKLRSETAEVQNSIGHLIDLELLTRQWPSPSRPSTSIFALQPKHNFPTLHLLSIDQDGFRQLRKSLRAIASEKNTHRRESLYKIISRLCPKDGRLSEVPSQKARKDDPLSRSCASLWDGDSLCDELSRLSFCWCNATTSDSRLRQHMMSLRLPSTGSYDNGLLLETVFQASELHQEQPPERGWRSIAVHMARQKDSVHDDTVAGAERHEDTSTLAVRPYALGSHEFCRLLLHDRGPVQYQFYVFNDTIVDTGKVEIARQSLPLMPTVSLADMMATSSLSDDGKLLLAHALAHSVWFFYETKFMSTRWTQEQVHFLHENRRPRERSQALPSTFVNPNYAYVPMALKRDIQGTKDAEFVPGEGVVHWAPRIFSLGVMLTSIFGDQSAWLDNTKASWQADLNREAFACQDLINDPAWPLLPSKSEIVRYRIRKAVAACLNCQAFNDKAMTESQRREKLENEVLWPLQYVSGVEKAKAQNARWMEKQLPKPSSQEQYQKACQASTLMPEQFSRLKLSESTYKRNQSRDHSKMVNGNIYVQGNYTETHVASANV